MEMGPSLPSGSSSLELVLTDAHHTMDGPTPITNAYHSPRLSITAFPRETEY
jgi:hypothetical protein